MNTRESPDTAFELRNSKGHWVHPQARTSIQLEDSILWRCPLEGVEHVCLTPLTGLGNPCVVGDSIVMSVFSPGRVVAVDREQGEVRWQREFGKLGGYPVVAVGDRLFINDTRTVRCLDVATGRQLWSYEPARDAGEWIYSVPTVFDGRLFFGDRLGFVHCLDSESGRVVWRKKLWWDDDNNVNSRGIVSGDVVVYANNAGILAGLDCRSGEPRWMSRLDSGSIFELSLHGADIFVPTAESVYIVSHRSGGTVRRLHRPSSSISSIAASPDGTVILNARNGRPQLSCNGQPYDEPIHERIIRWGCDGQVHHREADTHFSIAIRFVAETGFLYESRFGGCGIIDPKSLDRVAYIRPSKMPCEFHLPEVVDGVLYAAVGWFTQRGRTAEMIAIRHPKLERS